MADDDDDVADILRRQTADFAKTLESGPAMGSGSDMIPEADLPASIAKLNAQELSTTMAMEAVFGPDDDDPDRHDDDYTVAELLELFGADGVDAE